MADDTKKGGYFEGMTNRSPSATDKSTTPKGGSVDDDAVRKGPASTPKTLGPRSA
jgi:hypothetical protein